jgi:hypothetical protein
MKRFQWKWIFTGSKTCCTILRPFRFAMVAILNPKWPPKYKNPPIWAKFGFQVDYDVANWYPNFRGMLSTMSRCADYFRNFQNGCRCLEFFSDMCVHNFEAWKFQNGHHCHKKHGKIKVLGIGWNLIEMLYGMCIPDLR